MTGDSLPIIVLALLHSSNLLNMHKHRRIPTYAYNHFLSILNLKQSIDLLCYIPITEYKPKSYSQFKHLLIEPPLVTCVVCFLSLKLVLNTSCRTADLFHMVSYSKALILGRH